MLEASDRRWLEHEAGRQGTIARAVLLAVPVVMLLLVATNVLMAMQIGHLQGLHLTTLLKDWAVGTEWDRVYTGVYLKAMDRLDVAFLQLGVAAIGAAMAIMHRTQQGRCRRILAALEARRASESPLSDEQDHPR
jgi:hypothetical protein